MKDKQKSIIPTTEFERKPPQVFIEVNKPDPLYEKAFLSTNNKKENEFAENTTTWD